MKVADNRFIHDAADATAMHESRYRSGLGIEDANPKFFWLYHYYRLKQVGHPVGDRIPLF
jgi:hypothetical protein